MVREPEPVPDTAVAPKIAALLREIAEARRFTQYHVTQLFNAMVAALRPLVVAGDDDGRLTHEQVHRWWNGERLVGAKNEGRLIAAFPEFAAAIRSAVKTDRKHSRKIGLDASPEELDDLRIVLGLMRQLDWREAVGAIKSKLTDLGAKLPAGRSDDSGGGDAKVA